MIPEYPISREEEYLNAIATDSDDYPAFPISREEQYLDAIAKNGGGTKQGYFYNGQFYKDPEHTELIEAKEGKIYYDSTNKNIYVYNGTKYERVGLTEIGRFLSVWNAVTGLPNSNPTEMPYSYKSGDFYIVGTVGTTNYKPNGTTYDGEPSEVVETGNIGLNDSYFFDGTNWLHLKNHDVDLTNYYTKSEVNGLLDEKLDKDIALEIIRLEDGDETLAELNDRLVEINEEGRHVLFDTSAIDIEDKLYLCTIYIDDAQYRLHDQVTGMTSIGAYDEDKTLAEILDEAMKDLVTITVTSIATDGVTVTGTTVTLRNGQTKDSPIIATKEYDGQPVTFVVQKNTPYYVQGSLFAGHFPVDDVKGIATTDTSILFNYRDYGEVSTFADVQELARAGVADEALEIGQEFTIQGISTPALVMGFINNNKTGSLKIKDSSLQQGVIFQFKDCTHSLQFDEREAFYACTDGLQAGDYYFKLGEHTWVGADVNKNFYFHINDNIPAGGQLVFVQGYNVTLENATINIFDSPTSYSPSQTATLSSTEISGATNLGTLMNAKVGKFNSCQRALLGNNNWKESALRQMLNSNSIAGAIWTPQNVWDRAPSWRTSVNGFLYNLPTSLTDCIAELEVDTYRNTVCDEGGLDTTSDKVFLVGNNEIFCPQEGSDNGVAWDYYKENSQYSTPNGSADPCRIKKYNGSVAYWWWRSPCVSVAYDTRTSYTTGERYGSGAYSTYGVASAFVIA